MEFDVNKFITTGEDGAVSVDHSGLNTALTQHIDSLVSKGVDSYKKKQSSANDQANAQLVKQVEELTLKYNRAECKSLLAGELFSDKERELLLNSLVSSDLTKSQETLNALVAERKALDEANTQKIIASLQAGQPDVKNAPTGNDQKGAKQTVTKSFQQQSKDIKDFYK